MYIHWSNNCLGSNSVTFIRHLLLNTLSVGQHKEEEYQNTSGSVITTPLDIIIC